MAVILGSVMGASAAIDSQLPPSATSSVPFFEPSAPAAVAQAIEKSKGRDWQKVSIRALNFCSSVALGSFTGLACAGVMVTPMGWAIASGTLVMGLGLAKETGGSSELMANLGISATGFALAVGPAYLSTKSVVATVVCIAAEIMLLFMVKMAWDKQSQKSNIPDAPAMDHYPEVPAEDEALIDNEDSAEGADSSAEGSNPPEATPSAQPTSNQPIHGRRRGRPRIRDKDRVAANVLLTVNQTTGHDPRRIAVSTTELQGVALRHVEPQQRPEAPKMTVGAKPLRPVATSIPAK